MKTILVIPDGQNDPAALELIVKHQEDELRAYRHAVQRLTDDHWPKGTYNVDDWVVEHLGLVLIELDDELGEL